MSRTLTLKRTYPKTAHAQVNAEMAALVDGMADAARAEVPKGAELIDVGAVITRSGALMQSHDHTVILDRPYVMAIVDRETEAVVFLGVINSISE